ncbi:related to zinc metalloprotease [Saccharomycodes ludwigii]|uniref:Related to zinc metalloprotease n=1 Tax=Saccharomycodes ludwigii TaxID=36035 RepID=A0A376B3B3_9ASCO|nr:related to zinc metalloprotease [Saccharomycodes ludwigii]
MVFNKALSFKFDYAPEYTLNKYISSRTKLQLIHVNSKASPLVHGYFAVGTEITNDSGCPHTLEHLIFLGSKKYPFKGLLDTAGNLCMSNTNAWTATDQTVYTLSTAGWKGFKKLLPVYLDHLINPTLTDEACYTEVHHIEPDTLQDKGVVYSEMEAIESQSWFVTNLEKQRLMFDVNSGYRSETGGLTDNLRSLSNAAIRNFHKEMYSSDNMCLIIIGNVPEQELVDIVTHFDNELPEIESQRRRPFVDTATAATLIPRFNETTIKEATVEFPELDESLGEISFSWITEKYENVVQNLAINVLMEYLTEESLSVFYREIIEIEDPLSTEVEYWTDDFYRTIINLDFHGVPTEKLQLAKTRILQLLSEHKVNLKRIKDVLENYKWDYLLKFENNSAETLSRVCITDFLYASNVHNEALKQSLGDLNGFDELSRWDQAQWQKLFEHWLLENKPVIVLGKPSAALYERMDESKKQLLEKRKSSLGPNGIIKLRKQLEQATEANNKPIPDNLLKEFLITEPAKSVDFLHTKGISVLNSDTNNDLNDGLTTAILKAAPKNLPLFMHLEHFPSQFVEVHLLLNARNIKNAELLPYYYLFDELFSMPMRLESGEILPFEKVVCCLKNETIDASITSGLQVSFADFINIHIRAKASEYENSIKWIKHSLFDMLFDRSRLEVLLDNFVTSIPEWKREGHLMLNSLINTNLFEGGKTLKKATDILYAEGILKGIAEDIKNGKFETKILPQLNEFKEDLVTNIKNCHILILGDMEGIGPSNIYKPWLRYFPPIGDDVTTISEIPPVPVLKESLSEFGSNLGSKAFIITTPASESSYMKVLTNLSITYDHPDYPAVVLASQYLECVEGPFWKGIRGLGLAYGCNIVRNMDQKNIGYSIYRGADIIKCYEAGFNIVQDYSSGKANFEALLIEGAISSFINEIASSENSYVSTGLHKYVNTIWKNNSLNYNEKILSKLKSVKIDDLVRVMNKYLLPMFTVENGSVFISCHPSKLEDIQGYFKNKGYEVLVEELCEDSDSDEDSDSEED